jgi:hypothetical protein
LLTLQYLLVIHRKAWLWNNTENMGAGNLIVFPQLEEFCIFFLLIPQLPSNKPPILEGLYQPFVMILGMVYFWGLPHYSWWIEYDDNPLTSQI